MVKGADDSIRKSPNAETYIIKNISALPNKLFFFTAKTNNEMWAMITTIPMKP